MQAVVELILVSFGVVVWAFVCCWFIQLMPARRTFTSFTGGGTSKVEQATAFFILPWVLYVVATILFR